MEEMEKEIISKLDYLKEGINDLKKMGELLKRLEKKSGVKITKTSGGRKFFELEDTIMEDFDFDEKSLLLNLNNINLDNIDYDYSNIQYSDIFDESVIRKIRTYEFQSKINQYLSKSDEIYSRYTFFDKGNFTLPKLKDIQKNLDKNNFFVKNNKVVLDDGSGIEDLVELKNKINEIEKANNILYSNTCFNEKATKMS